MRSGLYDFPCKLGMVVLLTGSLDIETSLFVKCLLFIVHVIDSSPWSGTKLKAENKTR